MKLECAVCYEAVILSPPSSSFITFVLSIINFCVCVFFSFKIVSNIQNRDVFSVFIVVEKLAREGQYSIWHDTFSVLKFA